MGHTSQLTRQGQHSNQIFFTLIQRTAHFTDPADKARHDRMVALVTQMLDLNKRLQDAKLEHEKTLLSPGRLRRRMGRSIGRCMSCTG